MRTAIRLFFVGMTLSACTSTKHQLVPRYGFDFQSGESLVIARFQNASGVSDYATERLVGEFQQCADVEVVPPDTVQNFFYKNLMYSNPVWEVDIPMMVRIRQATQARYLLVGTFLGESDSHPPVSFAERHPNGQLEDMHKNWTKVQFLLYDLATHRTELSLQTRTKARQYNHEDDDGDVISFFAPANLKKAVLDKGIKKLVDACGCN